VRFKFEILLSLCLSLTLTGTSQSSIAKIYHLIIGTYTTGKSQGIYVYSFNTVTSEVAPEQIIKEVSNPSFLAVSPNRKFVYSVTTDKNQPGAVRSFSFNVSTGLLTSLNQQSSGSQGPCYVSVDKTGKFIFVANYGGGSLTALPVKPDGSLDSASQHIVNVGYGVNKERQDKSHVHSVFVTPDNECLLSPDLGTDKVMIYHFNSNAKIPLTPANPAFFETIPGSGPRHIAFHPNNKFAYIIQEMSGTISAFLYQKGKLKNLQTITMLKEGFKGEIRAADIHVSPDGKFLYGSNRGDANEIVIYSIDANSGRLQYVGRQSSLGTSPRNFIIDPTGNFILVANEKSDDIFIFKRDKITGLLTETPNKINVGNPVCLIMTPKE
jgi:6-phosphogluconolactonase